MAYQRHNIMVEVNYYARKIWSIANGLFDPVISYEDEW